MISSLAPGGEGIDKMDDLKDEENEERNRKREDSEQDLRGSFKPMGKEKNNT